MTDWLTEDSLASPVLMTSRGSLVLFFLSFCSYRTLLVHGSHATCRHIFTQVVRKGVVIHTGALNALKHLQNDVDSVAEGQECGLSFANFSDIEEGDQIKCLEVVEE